MNNSDRTHIPEPLIKLLKDNSILLAVLLLGCLVYITIYWGKWELTLVQDESEGDRNKITLSENLTLTSEHFLDERSGEIGTLTGLAVEKNCTTIDSISVKFYEYDGDKLIELPSTSKNLPAGLDICGPTNVSLKNVFSRVNPNANDFVIRYYLTQNGQPPISKDLRIHKKNNFRIGPASHLNMVALLYPILWMAFGVLILVKITKLIKD